MTDISLPNGVVVASGKGGVGKTWFSITLSQALAKRQKKVLLLDADIGLANVDIQLGLMPDKDLTSVLEQTCSIQDAIVTYQTDHYNFDILSGRSGTGNNAKLTPSKIDFLKKSIASVSSNYDYVIIDVGAGLDDIVQGMSSMGRQCLVIVTTEPTSMTDAYAFIKVMGQKTPALDTKVVINMAPTHIEGERTYLTLAKVCESFLKKVPILAGIVSRDTKVSDSIRAQVPVTVKFPTTQAALDVDKIAQSLTAQ